MSDTGPESLTLRHLRALDERLERMEGSMARSFATVTGHLIALTGRIEGMEVRMAAIEAWTADTTRLERIERRTGLEEAHKLLDEAVANVLTEMRRTMLGNPRQ